MDKQIMYKCTMDYYSALKREKILTHIKTEVNIEDTTLSEISISPKDKHCVHPLM